MIFRIITWKGKELDLMMALLLLFPPSSVPESRLSGKTVLVSTGHVSTLTFPSWRADNNLYTSNIVAKI